MASTRLTRVIVSSIRLTRQWRHFCTEASPSPPSTPRPSPTPTPSTAPTFKPPKRGTRKSSRSGSGVDVSRSRRPSRSGSQGVLTQGMWDSNELEQMEKCERKKEIFLQSNPSYKEMLKFCDEEYDKMKRNETKYPGELTKILTWKGWRLYKPTFKEIPNSLPRIPSSLSEKERQEWQRIFMENRERWYKEGLFDVIFEGNVFELGICIESACLDMTEAAALGIHWGPIKF